MALAMRDCEPVLAITFDYGSAPKSKSATPPPSRPLPPEHLVVPIDLGVGRFALTAADVDVPADGATASRHLRAPAT